MPILNWLTREEDIRAASRVPYRLLEEVPELSAGDPNTGNMLIQGDNLEALKSLLPFYAGQVKCIYIDPPYNTGSAFEHYDDALEHSKWLAMIWPRIELLRDFLSEDGSIWVSVDDAEGHYLKVVLDEIFGRDNFSATIIWEKRKSRENRRAFSFKHDFILVYGRNRKLFEITKNQIPMNEAVRQRYRNPDNDPRGPWQSVAITAQAGHGTAAQFYDIETPKGRIVKLPAGNCWRFSKQRLEELIAENRIYFGVSGTNVPRQKKFLSESGERGLTPETIWYADEVSTNDAAKRHINRLFHQGGFDTPKPEELIERIFHIATNPNDLVLDSFLGSGTAAAVAHKMNRRYIGIEMGDHAASHCVPRLARIIDGENGGISEAVAWKGGGGFRFFRLGATVFNEDGQIQPNIKFDALAAHIWFSETSTPLGKPKKKSAFLGVHEGVGYALLYNGILGDKTLSGGNVLTRATLDAIRDGAGKFDGPLVIYGERSAFGAASLERERITFKQTDNVDFLSQIWI